MQDSSVRTAVALRMTSTYALDGSGRWDGPATEVDETLAGWYVVGFER